MIKVYPLLKQKYNLTKKESKLHDPGDKFNMIPWLYFTGNADRLTETEDGEIIVKSNINGLELDQFLDSQYDYRHLNTLFIFTK